MGAKRLSNITFDGCPFPVGGVFMTFANQNPSAYWPGTTWSQIAAGTFLAASGTGYDIGATGGAASVTLTAAQSGVPAHSHGLNSHTHTLSSHTHTTAIGSHSHTSGGGNWTFARIRNISGQSGAFRLANYNTTGSGVRYGFASSSGYNDLGLAPSVDSTDVGSKTSGGPSNNTSGAASGSTANNTAANASSAHENRPPYIAVAMWQRTA